MDYTIHSELLNVADADDWVPPFTQGLTDWYDRRVAEGQILEDRHISLSPAVYSYLNTASGVSVHIPCVLPVGGTSRGVLCYIIKHFANIRSLADHYETDQSDIRLIVPLCQLACGGSMVQAVTVRSIALSSQFCEFVFSLSPDDRSMICGTDSRFLCA